MEISCAFILARIEVFNRGNARFCGGVAHRIQNVPTYTRRFDPPGSAGAMVRAIPEKVILYLAKHGEDVVPAPAGQACIAPSIIVSGLPPHRDHRVDSRRAAQDFPAGIVQRAPVKPGLRCCLKHPVRTRIADGEQIADRNVEPDPIVPATRFKNENAGFRIARQPLGNNTPCRPGAGNDIIIFAVQRVQRVSHQPG